MGNGKRDKKPKRRTIEHKPIALTRQQRINQIRDHLAWLDREEERLLAEQANG